MNEVEDVLANLRSVARKLWPDRPIEQMTFSDESVALGALIQSRLDATTAELDAIRSSIGARVRVMAPGYAEGVDPQWTAAPRGRKGLNE